MFAFLDPVLLPIHNVIETAADWLPMPLCIVLLTVLVRLAMHPLTRSTYRSGLQRRRISPQVRELQERHKKNPEKLRAELMELHSREGVSPAAGCLPTLLQLPVLGVVYRLFSTPQIAGQANALLHHTFSGVPLTAHLATAGGGIWLFGVLIAVALVVAWLIMRQTRASMAAPGAAVPTAPRQAEVTATMNRILPMMSFGTVAAIAVLPLATSLYLVTSATWTYCERLLVRRTILV